METTTTSSTAASPEALLVLQFLDATRDIPAETLARDPIIAFYRTDALGGARGLGGNMERNRAHLRYFWFSVWILTMHRCGVNAIMDDTRKRTPRFDWEDYRRNRDAGGRTWLWHDGNRLSLADGPLERGDAVVRLLRRGDSGHEVELWQIESVDAQSMKGTCLHGWTIPEEEMVRPVDVSSLAVRLGQILPGAAGNPGESARRGRESGAGLYPMADSHTPA